LKVFSEALLSRTAPVPALHLLAAAISDIEEDRARLEAENEIQRSRLFRRKQLATAAKDELEAIRSRLFTAIQNAAFVKIGEEFVELERSTLVLNVSTSTLKESEQERWDVVVGSVIAISTFPGLGDRRYHWSSSLLYARKDVESEYRWYEVGFQSKDAQGNYYKPFVPFAPGPSIARGVLVSEADSPIEIAYGPLAIDAEDETSFIERWVKLLVLAIKGDLDEPSTIPIDFVRLLDTD
jgi:hypothetical protein